MRVEGIKNNIIFLLPKGFPAWCVNALKGYAIELRTCNKESQYGLIIYLLVTILSE